MLMAASSSGFIHRHILVTMAKLDCTIIWSQDGPKPCLNSGQALPLPMAPMPVRTISPLASTSSRPQMLLLWSPAGLKPRSSALPMTLPQPLPGVPICSAILFFCRWSYMSKNPTPGSTMQ